MQDKASNGQIRIASKEATSLDGDEPAAKTPGEFAPRLVLELTP
jgi:hypothetical protein